MTNDFAKRLLDRVRKLREAHELSQEAFAERAGLKYKHYQAVEAGRKPNIQLCTLVKMAKALGLQPWELLKFDRSPQDLVEDPPKAELRAPHTPHTRKSPKRSSRRSV